MNVEIRPQSGAGPLVRDAADVGAAEEIRELYRDQSAPLPEGVTEPTDSELARTSSRRFRQRVAMDKLGEIVADYSNDHDPFTQEEIEAARAALRHDKDAPGGCGAGIVRAITDL